MLLEMFHQGKLLGGIAVRLKRSIRAISKRKAMLQQGAVSTEPALPRRPSWRPRHLFRIVRRYGALLF